MPFVSTLRGKILGASIALALALVFAFAALVLSIRASRDAASVAATRRSLIVYSLLENFGFRQLQNIWRLGAYVDLARGRKEWGAQRRKGFNTSP